MEFSEEAHRFMQRAQFLALRGLGTTRPNPLVGCVLVKDGNIIGEGWHRKWGEAHAEVNALNSVNHPELIPACEAYVNLEPCSHYGKNPPCADRLIEEKIGKVYVSNLDPNPLVAGRGLAKLQEAGIEVFSGIEEAAGRELNRRFLTFFEQKRPYILLKWAETADGFLARSDGSSQWISQEFSRMLVHKWRAEEAAILVGTRTAQVDNPQLNVRDWTGPNPLRVLLDQNLRLVSENLNLLDGSLHTRVYNVHKEEERPNLHYRKVDQGNFLEAVLQDLYESQIQSILVEGGATLIQSFLDLGLWDEARIFKSKSQNFGEGLAAPSPRGQLAQVEEVMGDYLFYYRKPS